MENNPVQELLVVATQKYGVLNSAEQKLFTLAQEKFQELRASEYELFRAIANGKPIDYCTRVAADDQPEHASQWGEERTLRGDRLRWLCLEPAVWQLCLPQGLDVAGAKIEGALNLSFSDVAIPLRFAGCSFSEALRLQQTRLRRLDLSGTHLAASEIATVPMEAPVPTSIDAREVAVAGSILLLQGFAAEGTVILRGARIEGNLDCSQGQFLQPALALDLEGAAVKGYVCLIKGFEAKGTVDLVGATIGGDLGCGGQFLHAETALNANGAQVSGSVFLRNGFEAQGTVILSRATIGGDLDCGLGGQFLHAATALNANRAQVNGSVFLSDSFEAQGTVNLVCAMIGSNLDCSRGKFLCKETALNANSAQVSGSVFLCNGFEAQGTVDLLCATIGSNLDCSRGKFLCKETALNANSAQVSGSVFLRNGFKAQGIVDLVCATIGSNLECSKGQFLHAETALTADRVHVNGYVFLRDGFEAQGTVILSRATIGSNLECSRGQFLCKEIALTANSAQVSGSVFLSDSFEAQGTVILAGATIGSNLECSRGQFLCKEIALTADRVHVSGYVGLRNGFQAQGRVNLAGAMIGSILQIMGVKESHDLSLDLQFANVRILEHAVDSFPASGELKLNGLVYESWGSRSPQSADKLLEWLRLQPKDTFSSQPYEQLARVLRSTGRGDEAVEVLIGKESDQLQFGRLKGFSKVWKRVLGLTIAYGYRPQNAIYMAIGVVAVGAFLFGAGYQQGLITPTDKDCSSPPSHTPINDCAKNPNYPKFNPLIYSLDVFVPIIDLRLKSAWQPSANAGETEDPILHLKAGARLRYYFWLHIFLGWVLTTLWVAGFSGLVRNTNK